MSNLLNRCIFFTILQVYTGLTDGTVCPDNKDWRGDTFIFVQPAGKVGATSPQVELHVATVGDGKTFTSTVNGVSEQTRTIGADAADVIKYNVADLTQQGSYKGRRQVKVALTPSPAVGILAVANVAGTTSADEAFCGMSAIYPTDQWGYDYFLLLPGNANRSPNEFQTMTITTDTDNTLVLVQFRGFDLKITLDGRQYSETQPLAVTLSQADVLQIQETSGADMSGTRITATQPIAVFGGITELRYSQSDFLVDSVFEQMPRPIYVTFNGTVAGPVYVMGTPQIAALKMRTAIAYKVVSLEESDNIYDTEDALTAAINTVGGFLEATPATARTKYIRVSKSSIVALIITSTREAIPVSTAVASPALVFIQPDSQWKHWYVVTIPTTIGPFTTATDMVVAAVISQRVEWGDLPNGTDNATDIPITVVTVPGTPTPISDTQPVPDSATQRGTGPNDMRFQVTSYDLTGKRRAEFTTSPRVADIAAARGRPDTDFGLYVLISVKDKGTCFMAYSPDGCYADPDTIQAVGINAATDYQAADISPLAESNEPFSTCTVGSMGGGRFTLFMPDKPADLRAPSDGWSVYAVNTGYEDVTITSVGTTTTTSPVDLRRGQLATFKVLNIGDPGMNQPQTNLGVKLSCVLKPTSFSPITPTPPSQECRHLKVYAAFDQPLSDNSFKCSATSILPDSALYHDYRVMSVKGQAANPNSFAVVGIMATEANVDISVVLFSGNAEGCTLLKGGTTYAVVPGTTSQFTLVYARDTLTLRCDQLDKDISGLRIRAPYGKKLAVFSGIRSTDIGGTPGSADMIWEQMIPTSSYGRRFAVAKSPNSGDAFFKIMAREDTTTVTVKGGARFNLNAGQVYDNSGLPRAEGGPVWISSDKPVMVGTFTPADATLVNSQPSFLVLPAVEQWESAYTFYLPGLAPPATPTSRAYIMLTSQTATDKIMAWIYGSSDVVPQSATSFKVIPITGWENVIGSAVGGSASWQAKTVEVVAALFEGAVTFVENKRIILKHSEGTPFGATVAVIASDGTNTCSKAYQVGACLKSDIPLSPRPSPDACSTASGSGSFTGRTFYLMVMPGAATTNNLQLYLTNPDADNDAVVDFQSRAGPISILGTTVPKGESVEISASLDLTRLQANTNTIEDKGIYITSNGDITIQVVNRQTSGCGGFQLIPDVGLGQFYYAFTKKADGGLAPQLGIMSTNDNTQVTIRLPPGKDVSVTYDGTTYTSAGENQISLMLSQFQTFVISANTAGASLLGTYISANERLAVFAGGQRGTINSFSQQGHFVEQMIPVGRQGRTFVVPVIPDQTNLFFSAVITKSGTLLTSLPSTVISNQPYRSGGETVTWGPVSQPLVIRSTEDLGIVQFSSSSSPSMGAPTSWNLIPIDNWNNVYTFYVPGLTLGTGTVQYYLLLTLSVFNDQDVFLDGNRVALSGTTVVTESDYITGWIEVEAKRHTVQLQDGLCKFGAYLYIRNQEGRCSIGSSLGACLLPRPGEDPETGVESPMPPTSNIDYRGTDFYFMWLESAATTESLRVLVTNPDTTGDISVTLNGQGINSPTAGTSVSQTVNSRQTSEFKINGNRQMSGSNKVLDKGYYLKADAEVLVQAFNPQGDGCGSLMVIPQDALGSDYYILTAKPSGTVTDSDILTEFGVVSIEANTMVTITIPTGRNIKFTYNSVGYSDANPVLVETMGTLEVLQIISTESDSDLSGTRVTASRNVAVFAGAKLIDIQAGTTDHIVEQMTPISTYGREYVIAPIPTIAPPTDSTKYMLISGVDGLVIPTDLDAATPTVNSGQTYPLDGLPTSANSDGLHLTLPKAALVAQYVPGQTDRKLGASSYFFLPAVDQWKTEYYINVPSLTEFPGTLSTAPRTMTMYLTLVVLITKPDMILNGYRILFGVGVAPALRAIPPDNTYSQSYVIVSSGTHHIQNKDGVTTFAVYAWGVDKNEGPTQQCALALVPDAGLAVKKPKTATSVCTANYVGSDFFAAYPPTDADMVLVIYNPGVTAASITVTVTNPGTAIPGSPVSVAVGEKVSISIPRSLATVANRAEKQGVWVHAGADISVFLRSQQTAACSGTQLIPVNSLGWNYYSMSTVPDPATRAFILIVGTQNNTRLAVNLPPDANISISFEGFKYGTGNRLKIDMTVGRYDTLTLIADNDGVAVDLSGTYIQTDQKIAVFTGNLDAIPGTGIPDTIMEQLMPTHTFGRHYALIPIPQQTIYGYTVVSTANANLVNTGGTFVTILNAGDVFPADLKPQIEPSEKWITATKGIQVAQYSLSHAFATNVGPAMVLIPSVEQYNTRYDFVTDQAYTNYMMITIGANMQNQLFLDENLLEPPTHNVWMAVIGSSPPMVGSGVEILGDTGGPHVLQHQDGQTRFGLWIYSQLKGGEDCNIAYNAGSCLAPQGLPTNTGPTTTFTLMPDVTRIYPTYGPKSGGTRLLISVVRLNQDELTAVKFGSIISNQFNWTSGEITIFTPAAEDINKPIAIGLVLSDSSIVSSSLFFTYKPDPVVIEVYPLDTIRSGGTKLTVKGQYLDSVAESILKLTIIPKGNMTSNTTNQPNDRTLSAPCANAFTTRTQLICQTPNTTDHIKQGQDYELYIGLLLDGVPTYRNLSIALPQYGQLNLHSDPTFTTWTGDRLIEPNKLFTVEGQSMAKGSRIEDYLVVIGQSDCKVVELTNNQLLCLPSNMTPTQRPEDMVLGTNSYYVLIQVGYSSILLLGVGRYSTKKTYESIIIGCSVGGTVLIIVAIFMCVCVKRRSKVRGDRTNGTPLGHEMNYVTPSLETYDEYLTVDANRACETPSLSTAKAPERGINTPTESVRLDKGYLLPTS